jgi:hypothetical protein
MNRTTLTGHNCTGVQLLIIALLRCAQNITLILWSGLECLLNNATKIIVILIEENKYKN